MNEPLLRFLGLHALVGVVIGWAGLAAVLYFDIGHLGVLAFQTDAHPIPIIMLAVVFAITGASAQVGIAVMSLSEADEPPPSRKDPEAHSADDLAVARAPARSARNPRTHRR
jgi:hypothetical protein